VSFLRHDQLPVYRCCSQHLFTFDATGRPKVPRLVFLRNLIALERNQSSRTAQSFLEGWRKFVTHLRWHELSITPRQCCNSRRKRQDRLLRVACLCAFSLCKAKTQEIHSGCAGEQASASTETQASAVLECRARWRDQYSPSCEKTSMKMNTRFDRRLCETSRRLWSNRCEISSNPNNYSIIVHIDASLFSHPRCLWSEIKTNLTMIMTLKTCPRFLG